MGDHLEAAEAFKKAAEAFGRLAESQIELLPIQAPDHHSQANAHTESALCYKELGSNQEAIEQTRMALNLVSDDIVAWLLAGELYLRLDRPGEAGEAYDGALGVDPHDEAALTGRSRAYLAAGHSRLALELARAAARIAPEFTPAWEALKEAGEAASNEEETRRANLELDRLAREMEEAMETADAATPPPSAALAPAEPIPATAPIPSMPGESTPTPQPAPAPAAPAEDTAPTEPIPPQQPAPAAHAAPATGAAAVVIGGPATPPETAESRLCCPACGAVSPAAEVAVNGGHRCPACGAMGDEGWETAQDS